MGDGAPQVRLECESLGQTGEHVRLGCSSNISVPGEMRPGDIVSADATCLTALVILLICNIIFQRVSHNGMSSRDVFFFFLSQSVAVEGCLGGSVGRASDCWVWVRLWSRSHEIEPS